MFAVTMAGATALTAICYLFSSLPTTGGCCRIAQPIFSAIIIDMLSDNPTTPPHDFNHTTLHLLPKKPSSISERLGKAYTPANLRPIAVVNTDNRIIASLFNLILTPFANKFCRPEQRGFLNHRYISSNIIDKKKTNSDSLGVSHEFWSFLCRLCS